MDFTRGVGVGILGVVKGLVYNKEEFGGRKRLGDLGIGLNFGVPGIEFCANGFILGIGLGGSMC